LTQITGSHKSPKTISRFKGANMTAGPAAAFSHEQYLAPQEAARFLSISAKTLTRFARQGMVPAHPIGDGTRRRWRFLKSELDTWMLGRIHSNGHLRSHQEESH
jgi:excisionase family DNA binding protein